MPAGNNNTVTSLSSFFRISLPFPCGVIIKESLALSPEHRYKLVMIFKLIIINSETENN